ncbi:MAG: hypothetical protein H6549_04710 [Chitinophagales bacterium]|nr:hypothetical protein [Chitinophagales bacterium]
MRKICISVLSLFLGLSLRCQDFNNISRYILEISYSTKEFKKVQFCYLFEETNPLNELTNKLLVGEKSYKINYIFKPSSPVAYFLCCEKQSLNWDQFDIKSIKSEFTPEWEKKYSDLFEVNYELYGGNLKLHVIKAYTLHKKKSKNYKIRFYKILNNGFCYCTPYATTANTSIENVVQLKNKLEYSKLSKEEKKVFSKYLDTILSSPLISPSLY